MRRFSFDPDRVAHFEAGLWRAYYDRAWLRVARLTLQLVQEQFHIPFPRSLLATFYVARASIAWVPVDHDEDTVRRALTGFYRIARRYSGLTFEPERAAALEVDYWREHRQLVGQSDKREFIDAMARLHAELFSISVEEAHESAEHRVEANNLVDRITGGLSTDMSADWIAVEDELQRCYRSIHALEDFGKIDAVG